MRRHAVAAHAVRCCCRVFARVDLGTEISVSTAAKLNMATRLRYALDAAKGMTFLHQHRNNNPIICAAVRWHSILPTAKPSPHDRAALMPLVAVLQREGEKTLPFIVLLLSALRDHPPRPEIKQLAHRKRPDEGGQDLRFLHVPAAGDTPPPPPPPPFCRWTAAAAAAAVETGCRAKTGVRAELQDC